MTSNLFKIENGKFGLSLTDPGITDACAAKVDKFTDFTCQITSGALNASPNISSETVPASWCSPEETKPVVGVTSYSFDVTFFQDPNIVDGISRFLFEHDAEEAWFFMGLDGDDPPKAVGKVRLVAGTIGGAGRTTLTATLSLPVDGKPMICFGDKAASANVGTAAAAVPTAVTAGAPGSFTPATAVPATLAALTALGALGATTAWTTGQSVKLGDGSDAHWDGTKWATGVA